ncbi:hypothetical protein ACFX1R_008785 [Malus domestica]
MDTTHSDCQQNPKPVSVCHRNDAHCSSNQPTEVLELDAGQQQGHGNRDDIADLRHAEGKYSISAKET